MSIIGDAIETKKVGAALDDAAIAAVVEGYTDGSIPDYQMAALLMAVRIQGMTYAETVTLTRVMADSGRRYSFPDAVDKHSTGGVGDKITLTSLPIVAACGVPVAKLSGRGLGTTGGTIDKLEAIPGWTGDLSDEQFAAHVDAIGLVVGAAGDLAPADKAIYALRDTTGTVDSLPLIGSSIVSKKVATGSGHVLYDVKAGSGAFMKTVPQARELADLLVRLSDSLGLRASALITDMDVALGAMVGNALEVNESLAFLRGEPTRADLREVALDVAATLVHLHQGGTREAAQTRVERAWRDGSAYEVFARFVDAQGGEVASLAGLPVSATRTVVTVSRSGVVGAFDALGVAEAALDLGAGRLTKSDRLDVGAGVEVLVQVGEHVVAGQPVAVLYGERNVASARRHIESALTPTDEPVVARPHILERL